MTFEGLKILYRVLVLVLVYQIVCIFGFASMYHAIGLDAHFQLPAGMKPTYAEALYFSFTTQATGRPKDIRPITPLARGMLSAQTALAFLTSIVLLVPWLDTATRATTSQIFF
jgi:hypothetical protein